MFLIEKEAVRCPMYSAELKHRVQVHVGCEVHAGCVHVGWKVHVRCEVHVMNYVADRVREDGSGSASMYPYTFIPA